MKKTTNKPSEIATVSAWGGVKIFNLGPAGIVFRAQTEKENKYTISCRLILDDIKKELSQARTSKKTLNAYKPASGYSGSHFIDSKK